MKKSRLILIITLMLIPMTVFASSSSSSIGIDIGMAIFMEAFVSIHMSVFVLKPLSLMFGKDDNKKLFWTLFAIRAAVLLYFDFFITTAIAMVDFFAVFIGAFIVVPICALITKTPIDKRSNQVISQSSSTASNTAANRAISNVGALVLKCTKCGSTLKVTDKFCGNCGSPFSGNNVTVTGQIQPKVSVLPSNFDSMYRLSEEAMVEEYINRQLAKAGVEQGTNLIPSEILKRKKVLNIIFSLLVFVFVSLIFFHFPIYTYILGIIILFIFYRTTRKYSFIKYLKKEIKSRPSEKISNIIMMTKSTLIPDNSKTAFIISTCVAIILPLIIFMNPRILYEKTDNGYGVRFYTFGITNFTSATIPSTYKNEKVVSLRGNTFSNMFLLEEVTLPDTITEIRGQAFKNNIKLTKVNMPSNLEYLGGGAFYNCTSLTSITIPDTVTYIGGETFYNATALERITLSNNITEIRGNTFENCSSLESITIPDTVTRIGGHAFYGCSSLSEAVFTENSLLKEIGSSAFRQCSKLYTITLPNNIYINERAFKESPTQIKYFNTDTKNDLSRHVMTIKNDGITSSITLPNQEITYLSITNAELIDGYLHLTLNLSGAINQTVELVCDGSTTYINDYFYIVTYKYTYKAVTTTFSFYY